MSIKVQKAISVLTTALEKMPELGNFPEQVSEHYAEWQEDTRLSVQRIFGDMRATKFHNMTTGLQPHLMQDQVRGYIRAWINELRTWPDDIKDASSTSAGRQDSRKVFLVHGKDEAVKQEVARFLTKLELEPVVLSEQAGKGLTIIEKLEACSEVGFAVVLLTPDDIGVGYRDEEPQPRARQNVIFEFGYFLGKLGRGKVQLLLIKKDLLESLSNYAGVEYIKFDDNGGWKIELVRELKAAGLNLDTNRLFDSG